MVTSSVSNVFEMYREVLDASTSSQLELTKFISLILQLILGNKNAKTCIVTT